jgi:hypothetical protein
MDIYWNIFTMHGPMNVKFPNNTRKWQTKFNSAFKGLMMAYFHLTVGRTFTSLPWHRPSHIGKYGWTL